MSDDASISRLAETLTTVAQWWEQLLHASGAKLELSKCFYYIISWKFDEEGRPALRKPSEMDHQVKIIDHSTGQMETIEQRNCTTPHETLGIWESIQNVSEEHTRIQEKCALLSRRVTMAAVPRSHTPTLYNAYILSSLGYGLQVGTLTFKQTCKMQQPLVAALLNSFGYNRHFPRSITFASRDIGGCNIVHLFAEQGYQQTMTILRLIRANRDTGKELVTYLKWVQKWAGTTTQVFRRPFSHIYLPPSRNKGPMCFCSRMMCL